MTLNKKPECEGCKAMHWKTCPNDLNTEKPEDEEIKLLRRDVLRLERSNASLQEVVQGAEEGARELYAIDARQKIEIGKLKSQLAKKCDKCDVMNAVEEQNDRLQSKVKHLEYVVSVGDKVVKERNELKSKLANAEEITRKNQLAIKTLEKVATKFCETECELLKAQRAEKYNGAFVAGEKKGRRVGELEGLKKVVGLVECFPRFVSSSEFTACPELKEIHAWLKGKIAELEGKENE